MGDGPKRPYLTLFFAMLPGGVLCIPLVAQLLARAGTVGAMQGVTLASALFGLLALVPVIEVGRESQQKHSASQRERHPAKDSVNSGGALLQAQPVTFAIYVFYRAALYSVLAAHNAATFGPASMGRVMGCMLFVAAIANLLIFPITLATNTALGGDWRIANGAFVAFCAPRVIHV